MDFILWPRNDIEKVVCLLFSRWKGTDGEPFRPVQAKFEFHHGDYEKQFLHLLSRKDKAGLIVNNPTQSIFLFINRQHLQTPKTKAIIFKLCSVCLYLPQDQLTHWGVGTIEDHLRPYMPDQGQGPAIQGRPKESTTVNLHFIFIPEFKMIIHS